MKCRCAGTDVEDAPLHAHPGGGVEHSLRCQIVTFLPRHAFLPGHDGAASHVLGLPVHAAAVKSGNKKLY